MITKLWNNAHILLAMAALSWAGHAIALRLSVGEISPMLLMDLRWLISFILLSTLFRRDIIAALPLVRARWRWFLMMGGTGLAGFTILLAYAAHHTTAMNLGILQGVMPAMVMLFGLLFYQTKTGFLQVMGFVTSLFGIVVLVSAGSLQTLLALRFNSGDLLMVAACFCYAGYVVNLAKRPEMPPLVLLCFFSFSAFLACSIFTVVEYMRGMMVLPGWEGLLLLGYCAVFPSILSQSFFMRGVELAGANRAGLYINLVPVFAAFLAVLILSESMRAYHVIALVAVVGGIFLAERGKPAG